MELTNASFEKADGVASCPTADLPNLTDSIAEKTLCVFTPTYNRAYCLNSLFASLKAQTCFDFCWLIVDDGSTDETEKLVESFQSESTPFPIEYIKQENGGKARAHNTGVEHCANELFFCVDSDDHLARSEEHT